MGTKENRASLHFPDHTSCSGLLQKIQKKGRALSAGKGAERFSTESSRSESSTII